MTPGPTEVPEAALQAMGRQVTHHRTPQFRALLAEVLEGLKHVLQTSSDVVLLASSGTGGMEAAVTNLVPRGGKALVLESGVFSRRWSDICRRYGIEVHTVTVPWGQSIPAEAVEQALREHPDAVAVFGTLMESSTGTGHDIEAIGRVVGASDALFVVDGISGAGAMRCLTDAWHVDVLVVGSQKALMVPPGLAVLSVSAAAWQQMDRIQPQAFYFDLKLHRAKLAGPDTPWTPAHTLIAGLAESLRLIRAEVIENVWQRCERLAEMTRAGVVAMGLEVFSDRPAAGMTAVRVPKGIDAGQLLSRLEQRFGVKLASGQLELKGKIFRIAHFGLLDELDIIATLAAIELVLDELRHPVKLGAAAAAASLALRESERTLHVATA